MLNLLKKRCNVVAILADPRLQPVILFDQTRDLAFAMLSQSFLLVKHVAELLVLILQELVVAVHLGHHDGIGSICRLLVGLLRRNHAIPALLLGLLQNIKLSLGHGQLHSHAIGGLLVLHHGHVVLQLVVRCRQSHITEDVGKAVDHGPELILRGIVDLVGGVECGCSLDKS